MFASINPYNQQKLKTYRPDSSAAIERKLKQADRAFADWSALSLRERTDYLRKVGEYLIKTSGFGRELSELGIKEFVNVKTVWVEKT